MTTTRGHQVRATRRVWWTATVVVVSLGVSQTPAQSVQAALVWQVDQDVTDKDKEKILSLAQSAGISQPRRATTIITRMPLGCLAVQVDSREVVDGPHRTSKFVLISRNAKQYCHYNANGLAPGEWALDGGLSDRDVWRVEDGSWHSDIALRDVSYDVARQIVLAMRRKTVVDRRTRFDPPFTRDLPDVPVDCTLTRRRTGYELVGLGGGGGPVLEFVINGSRVELIRAGMWIS